MAQMNSNIEGIRDGVRSTVAEAIAPLTARVDESTKRMDRIEQAQRNDRVAVNMKIDQLLKIPGKTTTTTFSASYAGAAKTAAAPAGSQLRKQEGVSDWYWDARKKLHFFPIAGKTTKEMIQSLDEFVLKKLRVPAGVLNETDIKYIRRVRTTKRSKIQEEALVAFNSVDARDLIQSHAKNLA